MDPQVEKMINNMPEKTGKSLADWLVVVADSGLDKHGQILKMLKADHGVTHGFANLIAHQALTAERPAQDLVALQYEKKPALKPMYDELLNRLAHLDFEVVPKKTAVALKRNKQFLYIQPSTRARLDVGIQLKGVPGNDRLKARSGMTSHVVAVTSLTDIDEQLINWVEQSFEAC